MSVAISSLLFVTMLFAGSNSSPQSPVAGQEPEPAPGVASDRTDADTIRQRVKEGQKVRILDDQGREWQGRIEALTPADLTLVTDDRQRRDLPYRTILRIDRPHDSLANGALIGFAAGAAFGLMAVVAEENADCDPGVFFSCGDPTAAAYVVAPAVLGGLGAGIGVAIDALIRREPNLFHRSGGRRVTVAPVVKRSVRGLAVAVRW